VPVLWDVRELWMVVETGAMRSNHWRYCITSLEGLWWADSHEMWGVVVRRIATHFD